MATKKKPAIPDASLTADDKEAKKKALASAISQIEKKFGKESIMKLTDKADMSIEAVSTGSLAIDFALGIGGLPKGRIVEIYGPESSGKTTIALQTVAEVQKAGGTAAFIDAEHALDPVYAKNLGVNLDELLISQPDSGEQALEICESFARSGAVDIIVIDSVAALVPQQELEGDMGASHVGLQARLMSQALRKLSGVISSTNCILIFINQLREKVGVMYGNPETTTGGRALKFYASVRIDVRKGEPIKNGSTVIGNKVKCKIVKNKVAPPFKTAEVEMIFGKGISKPGEIIDMAVNLDIIEKSGSWFYYNGERLAQGKDNVRALLEKDEAFLASLEEKIKAKRAALADGTEELADDDDDLDARLLDLDLDE